MITHEAQTKGAATNRAKGEERARRILARVNAGATHAEIAAEEGVNVTTVKTIVLRARRRLGVEVVRVGQRPAGPMADRRTKRSRDRSTRERKAREDQGTLL